MGGLAMMKPLNPFSTSRTRPGAVPFLFNQQNSAEELVDQLAQQKWWGQIIGPHGSGKSTLIQTLLGPLQVAGRRVELHVLRRTGEVSRPTVLPQQPWDAHTQLIVDGCEQLSWWQRRRLWAQVRRHHTGMLITAHRDLGLPTLLQIEVREQTFQRLVNQLLKNYPNQLDQQTVRDCFHRHYPNVREMLFALYDVVQQQKALPAPDTDQQQPRY